LNLLNKRNYEKVSFRFILLLTLSCNESKEDDFTSQTITPVLIAKGDWLGSENVLQQNTVVYNNSKWNDILSSIDQYTLARFSETNVNFNDFQIIAVFDKLYPYPTYKLNIVSITENENNIVVVVHKKYSPSAATVLSQQYQIVKIPKSDKPVVFELNVE